jgi:hypothetical protein
MWLLGTRWKLIKCNTCGEKASFLEAIEHHSRCPAYFPLYGELNLGEAFITLQGLVEARGGTLSVRFFSHGPSFKNLDRTFYVKVEIRDVGKIEEEGSDLDSVFKLAYSRTMSMLATSSLF